MSPHVAVLIASALVASGARGPSESRVGDWTVNVIDGLQLASVENDAGASAGVLCSVETEDCTAFFITNGACTEGDPVPMMLNSPVGAGVITTTCRHLPTGANGGATAMNVVKEFGTVQAALESGGVVGVAIPMASGAFRVLRFSTVGATAAIRQAMTLPQGQGHEPNVGPAKDISEL
jgi:hypothetical protein